MSKPIFKTQEQLLTEDVKELLDQLYSGLVSVTQAVFLLYEQDVSLVSYRDKSFIISCVSDWDTWGGLEWDVRAMNDAPENFYVTL